MVHKKSWTTFLILIAHWVQGIGGVALLAAQVSTPPQSSPPPDRSVSLKELPHNIFEDQTNIWRFPRSSLLEGDCRNRII